MSRTAGPDWETAHVAVRTHPGCVRTSNEDTVLVGDWVQSGTMTNTVCHELTLTTPVVCAVADGMGGHAAGDEASWLALRRLVTAAPALTDERAIRDTLLRIEDELNAAGSRPDLHGMGTTVAGVVLEAGYLSWFNVGDSRVYREQEGFLRQLSVDDAVTVWIDGRETRTGELTQCLGGGSRGFDVVHLDREPLHLGRRYLVCSDGLTDALDQSALEGALTADAAEMAQDLVDLALRAGGRDNVSVIVVAPGGGVAQKASRDGGVRGGESHG